MTRKTDLKTVARGLSPYYVRLLLVGELDLARTLIATIMSVVNKVEVLEEAEERERVA